MGELAARRVVGTDLNGGQVDEITRTTRPRAWAALAAIAVFLGALLVWGFLGSVPKHVSASAVIAVPGLVTAVAAPEAGIITWTAQPGDVVRQGQPLAYLEGYDSEPGTSVLAPVSGTVQSWTVLDGAGVSRGDTVAMVAVRSPSVSDARLVMYVSGHDSRLLEQGARATVVLPGTGATAASAVGAVVMDVAIVPSSLPEMTAEVGSALLAGRLAADAGDIPYRVLLAFDEDAVETGTLQGGEVIAVTVTIANESPIQLILGTRV